MKLLLHARIRGCEGVGRRTFMNHAGYSHRRKAKHHVRQRFLGGCGPIKPVPASTIVVGAGTGFVSLYDPCPERGMVSTDAGDPLEADHLCRSCSIEGRMSA